MYDIEPLYELNSDIDIVSYLRKNGIYDMPKYMNPTIGVLDDEEYYNNMQDGYELLKEFI